LTAMLPSDSTSNGRVAKAPFNALGTRDLKKHLGCALKGA